jgi:hypothetical protein
MAACIELEKRFGKTYRVGYEPAYRAEHGKNGRADDPWLKIIPCQRGHIFPWGGDRLAASIDTRGASAKQLMELRGVEVVQDASDGATVLFGAAF